MSNLNEVSLPHNTYLNYIGGQFVPSSDRSTFTTYDPANSDAVSTCQRSSVEDAKAAVDAAREAFDKSNWGVDLVERAESLIKFANYLESQDWSEAGRVLTRECGKPYASNLGEYKGIPNSIENHAFRARFLTSQLANPTQESLDFLLRDPVGVVGIIVPWNAPIVLLGRTLAPALAAGCSVVIKPASATAGATMELLKKISQIADIPKGVINCITGPGELIGAELAANPKVDMISFTGDVSTGKEIIKLSANNVKKLALELGGKSPNIVFSDANFERAVKGAVTGSCMYHAGQICYAGTRVLIDESCHRKFIDSFKSIVEKMKVGHGLDAMTEIGPVINRQQLSKVMDYINQGKKSANLVMGGNKLTGGSYDRGNFVEPTLFDNVPPDSILAQDEIFGPVVSVIPFRTPEEAAELANNSKYGLTAAVWSNDLTKVMRTIKKIRASLVWTNSYWGTTRRYQSAISGSGVKESGLGSMGSIEEYTVGKRVHMETAN